MTVGEGKYLEYFPSNLSRRFLVNAATQKYYDTHRDVLNERQRLRRQNDPEYRAKQNAGTKAWRERKKAEGTHKDLVRNLHLKRRYGITLDQYKAMLIAQNNVCAICKQPDPQGIDLAVDHNHLTNHNRGLLCGRCNKGIGLLQDSPAILQLAIHYLNLYSVL